MASLGTLDTWLWAFKASVTFSTLRSSWKAAKRAQDICEVSRESCDWTNIKDRNDHFSTLSVEPFRVNASEV
jgi:hypothetical protein